MEQRIVTIIGGTGFLGRYVVKLLAQAGYTIRIISRHPNNALHLKTSGSVGQIVLMEGDIGDAASLVGKVEDSYAIINLVGILYESGKQKFARIHTHGTEKLAQMAREAGVARFIQISALGVDRTSGSSYARSKLLGEKAVLDAFPHATILRPSVMFGPEDNFYNMFAAMSCLAPALPLIGGGKTRFQPVYVGDVAKAAVACIERADTIGQTYSLGGPHVYSFKEIMLYIMKTANKPNRLMHLPFAIAPLIGAFEEFRHWISFGMFKPLITRDQIKQLKHDNILGANMNHFAALGISPSAVEVIVPQYLARFHKKAA